jgi:hypothetical protein
MSGVSKPYAATYFAPKQESMPLTINAGDAIITSLPNEVAAMSELNEIQIKNDQFRRNLIENYSNNEIAPSVFLAPGLVEYYDTDPVLFYAVLAAVVTFSDENSTCKETFTEDNDPHHEHDIAFFEVRGKRFFFKIDYYDVNYEFHCGEENMLNDELCRRVLTVGAASDY